MIKLTTPLSEIRGIPEKFVKRLAKMEIKTVRDLLFHFPSRYEDFSRIYNIDELAAGQQATIKGEIQKIGVRRTWKRHMLIAEAHIADQTGAIRAVWFNQPYVVNTLKRGMFANFAGKVYEDDGELYLSNPAYERMPRLRSAALGESVSAETSHTARLVPIYSETKGLTSKGIRFLIKSILEQTERITEWIPNEVLAPHNLPEVNQALLQVHFPKELEDALVSKKRFAFEDLFLLQLFNLLERETLADESAPVLGLNSEAKSNVIRKLPFLLTTAQERVLQEILTDLASGKPMNRLLQGDVGSGKTVVAAMAALAAAANDYQSAFMAPTEVLARQHYETLKKLFTPITQKVSIALITGSGARVFYANDLETKEPKKKVKASIERGDIKIVLGTHALIQKDVKFKNLGLVVVDEQHRFGVKQRKALLRHHDNYSPAFLPHLLSMSATPIPRTLTLTIFGDLDLSIIDEMPSGRRPIITKVVAPTNRDKAYAFIRGQVRKGRQVFVICPRIEKQIVGNERPVARDKRTALWEDVKNVTEEYKKLSKKVFPDLRVEILHGKLRPKEKAEVMRKFQNRDFDILVSTSVVEVGIDVPNATIMMIESADRFGLAQLYQFRGRVGRGEHQSFCLLFTESSSKSVEERLRVLIDAKNGFELAEMDLKLRGPGEFLGTSQTGMPDIAMRALQNMELIKEGRSAAESVLTKSPDLKKYSALAAKLEEFKSVIHPE